MVDILQSDRLGIVAVLFLPEPGHERAGVVLPFHERVNRVAVSLDAGDHHLTVIVAKHLGLENHLSPTLHCPGKRFPRVIDP